MPGSLQVGAPGSSPLEESTRRYDLFENSGVLYLAILGKHQNLRENLGCLWIIVCKGEKETSTMLAVYRDDAQRATRLAVSHTAAQMHRIAAKLTLD